MDRSRWPRAGATGAIQLCRLGRSRSRTVSDAAMCHPCKLSVHPYFEWRNPPPEFRIERRDAIRGTILRLVLVHTQLSPPPCDFLRPLLQYASLRGPHALLDSSPPSLPVLNLPRAWPTEEGVGKQWFLTPFSVRSSISGPVNAVAPEAVTINRFCEALGRVLHRPSWLPVPGFALHVALGELGTLMTMGQRVNPAKALSGDTSFTTRRWNRPCGRSWRRDKRGCSMAPLIEHLHTLARAILVGKVLLLSMACTKTLVH